MFPRVPPPVPFVSPSTVDPVVVASASGGYRVHLAPLARVPSLMRQAGLREGRVLVVTDATVGALYGDALTGALAADGWAPAVHAVAPGEGSKTLAVYGDVLAWALAQAPDRATPVMALGGGVVGDLAGFVAATLLRGVPFVQVPTTTIAQVDSSVGGKTGVNTEAGKNLVGVFHAPAVVVADPAVLATLPEREFASGLAEAVKHALLSGGPLLQLMETRWKAVMARDAAVLPDVLRAAIAVKAAVVGADEREGDARAFLNFGHTFAHALEREAGYGALTHGEAVAVGMRAALFLSATLAVGVVPTGELPEPFAAMDRLVARLPVPPLPPTLSVDALVASMGLDKKRDAGGLRFVVLDAPGRPRLAQNVPEVWVRAAWASVAQ